MGQALGRQLKKQSSSTGSEHAGHSNLETMQSACTTPEQEQQQLKEALEASRYEMEFQSQVEEAIRVSGASVFLQQQQQQQQLENDGDDYEYAFREQLQEAMAFSSYDALSKRRIPQSQAKKAQNIFNTTNPPRDSPGPQKSRAVDSGKKVAAPGLDGRRVPKDDNTLEKRKQTSADVCEMCFEEAGNGNEMFEGFHCLHRFCEDCMTRYIHAHLQRHSCNIRCPAPSCSEPLSLQECRYFLPPQLASHWTSLILHSSLPS
eukprot:TRINITY_DN237_c0_g1_i3.p1 TRINITY_DN237_c0_g1~~TRINITY_DN237_c0_g1_i3.p1  ORF type:complete len:261 (+),score=22.27 TRINITY_DN237_c0_g1_i3:155-937(+)